MSFVTAVSNGLTATATKAFLAALTLRSVYALLLYSFMGDGGLEGVDSTTYASQAQSFAEAILAGSVARSHWLWGFGAIGMLATYSLWVQRSLQQVLALIATTVILCASLATIAVRSFDQYGTFSLTPQGGTT